MTKTESDNNDKRSRPIIIITVMLTMAALVVIGGVFSVVILVQQQASANTAITPAASHNKCSADIITCTHYKKTQHFTKDTTTPFDLPLPFP